MGCGNSHWVVDWTTCPSGRRTRCGVRSGWGCSQGEAEGKWRPLVLLSVMPLVNDGVMEAAGKDSPPALLLAMALMGGGAMEEAKCAIEGGVKWGQLTVGGLVLGGWGGVEVALLLAGQ